MFDNMKDIKILENLRDIDINFMKLIDTYRVRAQIRSRPGFFSFLL